MKARHAGLRALIAFLALPGVVAYALPIALAPSGARSAWWGACGGVLVGAGSAALLWCAWAFYETGRGTLAPWDPTQRLVRVGLYRHSRNPMYLAVVLVLIGWAVAYRSSLLAEYAGLMAVVFHLRVLLFEEPWLRSEFGPAWEAYEREVRRWL